MKRFYFGVLTIASTLLLVGCHFSENLDLNEDGTGKISINFDGSEIMKMGGDKISEEKKEEIDSVLVFKDFLEKNKDSISKLPIDQQEKLQRLKDFKMHMIVNSESGKMNMNMYKDFENVSGLGDVLRDLKVAMAMTSKELEKNKGQNPAGMTISDNDGTRVTYSFNNNKFSRITEIIDAEKVKKNVDSLEQMRMFLASSKYKLKYSFPRKIVKMSSDKATFSLDAKSFTLEVGFVEFMENPKILDVEVELEK